MRRAVRGRESTAEGPADAVRGYALSRLNGRPPPRRGGPSAWLIAPRPVPGADVDATTSRRGGRRDARAADRHVPARRCMVRGAAADPRCRRPGSTAARWTSPRLDVAAAILARPRPAPCAGSPRRLRGQRAAVALAEAIGAVIDPAGPLLDGAAGRGLQARGASTATLGDVRDRAEVVVMWRADPVSDASAPAAAPAAGLPDARPAVIPPARSSSSTASARRPPKRPRCFIELPRRAAMSRRCGRCARSSARSPSTAPAWPGCRWTPSASSPAACAPRYGAMLHGSGLCDGGWLRERPRAATRSSATWPRTPTSWRCAPPRGKRRRRRGRARLADRLPVGGELRDRASRARTRAS